MLGFRARCWPHPRATLVPHLPTCRSGRRCRQVRSRGCRSGHPAAAGAVCALPWRRAPGLVARRQSPKALWILERKRLEPPTFRGSLAYYPSAKEAQVGALGVSRTNGWRRSQGRPDLGRRLWKGWSGEPGREEPVHDFRSKGKAFTEVPLPGQHGALHKHWAHGLRGLALQPKGMRKGGPGICPQRRGRPGISKAHLCPSQGWEVAGREMFFLQEDPLGEGMATHSSILAWRIPWIEEPGGPLSMGSQRLQQDWSDSAHLAHEALSVVPLPLSGVQETKGNPIQHRKHCNPLSRPESCLLQRELNDTGVAQAFTQQRGCCRSTRLRNLVIWNNHFFFFKLLAYSWRRQWHPIPVRLPGKSHGRRSLVGCSPWGR